MPGGWALPRAVLAAVLLVAPLARLAEAACIDDKSDFGGCVVASPSYTFHYKTGGGNLTVKLEVKIGSGLVPWVGWGLSESGSMKGLDAVIITSSGGKFTALDTHALDFAKPQPDAHQDVTLLSAEAAGGVLAAVFTRPLAPCDPNDLAIRPGAHHFVMWAVGMAPILSYHGANRGFAIAALDPLPPCESGQPPFNCSLGKVDTKGSIERQAGDQVAELSMGGIQLPDGTDTLYMCQFVKLPTNGRKRHVIAYEGFGTPYTHHLDLWGCLDSNLAKVSRAQLESGENFQCEGMSPPCLEFVMGWTPGLKTIRLPDEAGFPYGGNDSAWYVLQVHFNNPAQKAVMVNEPSGFKVQVTDKLRRYDMGVLLTGDFLLALPPNTPRTSSTPNICGKECTSTFQSPIYVTQVQPHMHITGLSQKVQHFRGSTELAPLMDYRHFDFKYTPHLEPPATAREVLPGDELVTTCAFNTTGRGNWTYWGEASSAEMCYAFLFYYPRLQRNINTCIAFPVGPVSQLTMCGDAADGAHQVVMSLPQLRAASSKESTVANSLVKVISTPAVDMGIRGMKTGWVKQGKQRMLTSNYKAQCRQ